MILSDLAEKQSGVVLSNQNEHLLELGLTPRIRVEVVRKFHGLLAIKFRGSIVAVRMELAQQVEVNHE